MYFVYGIKEIKVSHTFISPPTFGNRPREKFILCVNGENMPSVFSPPSTALPAGRQG